MQPLLVIGIIVNSALYLGCLVAAGLIYGSKPTVCLAIAAFGVTYLCYAFQVMAPKSRRIAEFLMGLSVVVSMLAGLAVLR